MPDAPQLLVFIAAGLLLNLTPGPDVMFIVAHAVRGGWRRGVAAAFGICGGCLVHVLAAALGVSALLLASSAAFSALKWLGALYLAWVGVQMLRGALRPNQAEAIADGARRQDAAAPTDSDVSTITVLRRGFLTNVLNPKVALFFLAFVPQFIAPDTARPGGVFLALGPLFTAGSLLVCVGWALAAAWLAGRAGALQRATRWLDGCAGLLFIAFGIKLALTEAPAAR